MYCCLLPFKSASFHLFKATFFNKASQNVTICVNEICSSPSSDSTFKDESWFHWAWLSLHSGNDPIYRPHLPKAMKICLIDPCAQQISFWDVGRVYVNASALTLKQPLETLIHSTILCSLIHCLRDLSDWQGPSQAYLSLTAIGGAKRGEERGARAAH